MLKLWGLLKSDQNYSKPCRFLRRHGPWAFHSCLDELCHTMDIQNPSYLRKHENEFKNFGARFSPVGFYRAGEFSIFEVENITQKKEKNDRRPGR
jgi:hypothetical protein